MKIAILGSLTNKTAYDDWVRIFRRHFWKKDVSKICITGGETLLNTYVRIYAANHSIPFSVFGDGSSAEDTEAKLANNITLIQDADLVVVFTTNDTIIEKSSVEETNNTNIGGKKAIVINVDKQVFPSRKIIARTSTSTRESSIGEMLTVEEEVALIRRIQNDEGDVDEAKARLVYGNLRFVRIIAQKYATEYHPLDEVVTVGKDAIIPAAMKFDETKGFKFISYAVWWIKQSIEQHINESKKQH